jgi:RNase P/RNase MRP subunit p29
MNKMSKMLVLMASFATVFVRANAQIITDTEPITIAVEGYVVTHTQDTLRGKVNVTQVNNYVTQITYREPGGNKTRYTPADLRAFSQKRPKLLRDFTDLTTVDKDWVHYESHEHPRKAGKKVFMERLMNGAQIKLFNNPAGMENSTSLAGFKLNEKESSYVVHKAGSKPYILKKKNYEEEFNSLFGDCEPFMAFVNKNPDLRKFKNLGLVVESYNLQCR